MLNIQPLILNKMILPYQGYVLFGFIYTWHCTSSLRIGVFNNTVIYGGCYYGKGFWSMATERTLELGDGEFFIIDRSNHTWLDDKIYLNEYVKDPENLPANIFPKPNNNLIYDKKYWKIHVQRWRMNHYKYEINKAYLKTLRFSIEDLLRIPPYTYDRVVIEDINNEHYIGIDVSTPTNSNNYRDYCVGVINFDIKSYNQDLKKLSIVYYTIDKKYPINNIGFKPLLKEVYNA